MSSRIIAGALGAAIVVCAGMTSTTVTAADDPVASRQAIMKNVGASIGVLVKMAKGELEFDANSAQLALRVMNVASHGYGELFPNDSDAGQDTEASEKIWSNREGFNAEIVKFQTATAQALTVPPTAQDQVGPTLNKIGANCNSCHEGFRIQKK